MANTDQATQEPADTFQRHGDLDPSKWDEARTVTGRANDTPITEQEPAVPNTSFRDRAQNRMVSSDQTDSKSLSSMTKTELQSEADRRGIDIPSGATKAEMIEALGG